MYIRPTKLGRNQKYIEMASFDKLFLEKKKPRIPFHSFLVMYRMCTKTQHHNEDEASGQVLPNMRFLAKVNRNRRFYKTTTPAALLVQ